MRTQKTAETGPPGHPNRETPRQGQPTTSRASRSARRASPTGKRYRARINAPASRSKSRSARKWVPKKEGRLADPLGGKPLPPEVRRFEDLRTSSAIPTPPRWCREAAVRSIGCACALRFRIGFDSLSASRRCTGGWMNRASRAGRRKVFNGPRSPGRKTRGPRRRQFETAEGWRHGLIEFHVAVGRG